MYEKIRSEYKFNDTIASTIFQFEQRQRSQAQREVKSLIYDTRNICIFKGYLNTKNIPKPPINTKYENEEEYNKMKNIKIEGEIKSYNCDEDLYVNFNSYIPYEYYDSANNYSILMITFTFCQVMSLIFQMKHSKSQTVFISINLGRSKNIIINNWSSVNGRCVFMFNSSVIWINI
jgi:hypothetical protein